MTVIFAALFSCIPADVQALRQEDQERELLSASARQFWEGVRWEVDDQSADFITEDDRALFRVRVAEQRKTERLIETTILRVTLDDVPAELTATTDTWRTGTVLLQLEGYTLPAQIVKTKEHSQEWFRTTDGWFVEWDSDAPGPLTDEQADEQTDESP